MAREAENADQVRRLLAIAAVYEGKNRSEAARVGAMDRQRLRDWVHRFNKEGAAGLIDRKAPGAACRLTAGQEAEAYKLRNLIERMFCRLKNWRRIATRYDKLACNVAAAVLLAAIIIWWL